MLGGAAQDEPALTGVWLVGGLLLVGATRPLRRPRFELFGRLLGHLIHCGVPVAFLPEVMPESLAGHSFSPSSNGFARQSCKARSSTAADYTATGHRLHQPPVAAAPPSVQSPRR